jgi:hypothetical protein
MLRLAALHPLGLIRGHRKKAGAPAPLNNRGDDAWLFEILVQTHIPFVPAKAGTQY